MLRQRTTESAQAISTANEGRKMMKFDKVIKIEVEVQSIADLLLSQFPQDYKHKELVTEAIIATAVEKSTVGYIYNALCGFTPDINFQVGDRIMCTLEYRRVNTFQAVTAGEGLDDAKLEYKGSDTEAIGECEVIEVNPYSSEKLRVKYLQHKYRSQEMEESTQWVSHKNCEKIAPSELIPVDGHINYEQH